MTCIVVLASFAPSLRNFRGALIDEMLKRGHSVHAAAPKLSSHKEVHSWLLNRNVTCHDLPLSRSGMNPVFDFLTMVHIIKLFVSIRPDIFLGYTVKAVIWGLLAAKVARVPKRVALITGLGYAFTGRATGIRAFVRFIAHNLYYIALKQATLILFQNPDDRDEFSRLDLLPFKVRVSIVAGSGVDVEYYTHQPLPTQPTRILMIARLLGDKGIREYVEAARLIRAAWPNVEFHLVGGTDPSPDGIPEKEVALWHKRGDLIWHGHLEDVRDIISNTHIYALPSYREGMPRTVLEAMATGRPIITSEAPGCRQTVTHNRNGFLVPIKNPSAIAQAIEYFLYNPGLIDQMGIQSRLMAEEAFDVRLVNESMLSEMELD